MGSHRAARLHAGQRDDLQPNVRRDAPVSAVSRTPLLHLQRTIGNQAVQRYLNGAAAGTRVETVRQDITSPLSGASANGQQKRLQRAWADEQMDSRVEAKAVGEVGANCGLQKRKITYATQAKKPNDPYGSTGSHLLIEYAVDAETGQVTLGCMQPEYTITIFEPYITSDDFVDKFTPLMERYWDKYEGNMEAFSKDRDVGNFNYYDQTLRHEQKHADARNLTLMNLMPQYKQFLKDSDAFRSEAQFVDMTNRFWASGWDEHTEKAIAHERIHYLDAVEMVEEYQRRVGEDRPKKKSMGEQVNDTINEGISWALGGLFGG